MSWHTVLLLDVSVTAMAQVGDCISTTLRYNAKVKIFHWLDFILKFGNQFNSVLMEQISQNNPKTTNIFFTR